MGSHRIHVDNQNQSAVSTVIGRHLKIERTQEPKVSADLFPRCISKINEYCSFDF